MPRYFSDPYGIPRERRCCSLRRSAVIPKPFVAEITKTVREKPDDRAAAVKACRDDGSPIRTANGGCSNSTEDIAKTHFGLLYTF